MVSSILRCLINVLAGCWHSCSICCILFGAVLWSLGPWGHPYQVVDLTSACVVLPCVCIVITLLWCGVVFLADGGSWHFVPPPPTLIAVFISIYLFFLFIDSLLYSCFPLLSHLAIVWQCSLGAWCRTFQARLQAEQANLVFKHLRVQLWFQPTGLPGM